MILIYSFSNPWGTNISRRTLLELQKIISPPYQGEMSQSGRDKRVLSSKNNLNIIFRVINTYPQQFFQKYIHNNHYDLIIGLGDGVTDKIRIETQAKNAYNNKSIYPFAPIFLDLSLPNVDCHDPTIFDISSNMGTYNCNWIAFSTQLYLDQKKLSTQHLFLHLPKKANATFLAHEINSLLINNQII